MQTAPLPPDAGAGASPCADASSYPRSAPASAAALVAAIDALLPQTQCRQCGYAGCLPYAHALARGEAQIDRCPPGGTAGVAALAQLLQVPALPLDPAYGEPRALHVARIDEERCIGCTLCIQACPVDAILGASKHLHTVIAADCTGCDLCVSPCPMDCIVMLAVDPPRAWTRADADAARRRLQLRAARQDRAQAAADARLADARSRLDELALPGQLPTSVTARRHGIVEAALERVRQRRAAAAAAALADADESATRQAPSAQDGARA